MYFPKSFRSYSCAPEGTAPASNRVPKAGEAACDLVAGVAGRLGAGLAAGVEAEAVAGLTANAVPGLAVVAVRGAVVTGFLVLA